MFPNATCFRLLAPFLVALASLLGAQWASAQIVNVLDARVGEPNDGVDFSGNLTFSASGGAVTELRGSTGIELGYNSYPHTVLLRLSGTLAYADGLEISNQIAQAAFAHARYRWSFAEPFDLFAFTQVDHNRFRNLNVRWIVGAGPAIRIFRDTWGEARFGLAFMPEYLLEENGNDFPWEFRFSGFLTVALQLGIVSINSITYFQPRVDRLADFRFTEQLTMKIPISEGTTLLTTFTMSADTEPPAGVPQVDWSVSQGIAIALASDAGRPKIDPQWDLPQPEPEPETCPCPEEEDESASAATDSSTSD